MEFTEIILHYRNLTLDREVEDNNTVRLISFIDELTTEGDDINVSVIAVLIKNVFDREVYLTKVTEVKEESIGYCGSDSVQQADEKDLVYLPIDANQHQVSPFLITDSNDAQDKASQYGFDASQLSFGREINNQYIRGSGYYVASDDTASYASPLPGGIHLSGTCSGGFNYVHSFIINGVRNDCDESYANEKKMLFHQVSFSDNISSYDVQQVIDLKSCTNIRTADLDQFGSWIAERTWNSTNN